VSLSDGGLTNQSGLHAVPAFAVTRPYHYRAAEGDRRPCGRLAVLAGAPPAGTGPPGAR